MCQRLRRILFFVQAAKIPELQKYTLWQNKNPHTTCHTSNLKKINEFFLIALASNYAKWSFIVACGQET